MRYEDFKLKNKTYNKKALELLEKYWERMTYNQVKILKLVFMRYKNYSGDEEFLYFIIIYALLYFKLIDIESDYISTKFKERIIIIKKALEAELQNDPENFIDLLFKMDDWTFLLKIIMKSIIVYEPESFGEFIPDMEKYYKSLWRMIPILSYKEHPKILSSFQDIYFQKVYPEDYKWVKKTYKNYIEKVDVIENFMVDIINDISNIMSWIKIFGITKVRRKSYFSIYNKIKRKNWKQIYDFIGVRLILKDIKELKKFCKEFEERFIIESKKDYIKHPKPNGYQAIHYRFIYNFENISFHLEMQIKTQKMNSETHNNNGVTHFAYSLQQKKWDSLFKEVNEWVECVTKYLAENQ